MNARAALSKERVVTQLTEQLLARRTLALRRNRAYYELAEHVLGITQVGPRTPIVLNVTAECAIAA
jgi:hypothetical protein